MKLLCVDVGTGTQDILYWDTEDVIENAIQLIVPSPTRQVAAQIKKASHLGNSVLLVGETMGGGPSTHALKSHLRSGLTLYAEPAAALSFTDSLDEIEAWGVRLVARTKSSAVKAETVIRTADISMEILEKTLAHWNVKLAPDVIAVAVLDHGTAPQGLSQRLSRFGHLEEILVKQHNLEALIFTPGQLPECFTRMRAVALTIGYDTPHVITDTGAAAVLGASLDPIVCGREHRLSVNLGNSHTTCFLLNGMEILGFFEHHTGSLSTAKLDGYLERLQSGDLKSKEIWDDGGHGSYIISGGLDPFLVATGPRRALMSSSKLNPYFAAPHGNMMLTGCYGLAKAVALKHPEWKEMIENSLQKGSLPR